MTLAYRFQSSSDPRVYTMKSETRKIQPECRRAPNVDGRAAKALTDGAAAAEQTTSWIWHGAVVQPDLRHGGVVPRPLTRGVKLRAEERDDRVLDAFVPAKIKNKIGAPIARHINQSVSVVVGIKRTRTATAKNSAARSVIR